MNPGWETFGDFADDAFLGSLLFFATLAAFVWWSNRKPHDPPAAHRRRKGRNRP